MGMTDVGGGHVFSDDADGLAGGGKDGGATELAISVKIAYRNAERIGQPHEPCAFAWGQSARREGIVLHQKDREPLVVMIGMGGIGNIGRGEQAMVVFSEETAPNGISWLYALLVMIEEPIAIPWQEGFAAIGTMENGGKSRRHDGLLNAIPRKWGFVAKSRDDDDVPLLRHEVICGDEMIVNVVAKAIAQYPHDQIERVALAIRQQKGCAFNQDRAGLFGLDDILDRQQFRRKIIAMTA